MLQQAQDSNPGFTRRPSSTLGWAAVAIGTVSLALVVLSNAAAQRTGIPRWQAFTLFLGLLAACVAGLIAVLRNHERSWIVIAPTVLVSLVVINELVQGLLMLLGLGGE